MKKTHYYPEGRPDSDMRTACGRDGHKTGGFIMFFFETVEPYERCKICDKRFKEDQHETI